MSALSDHRLERTIFFSDAVIAIAITLLIIEIHVPHLPSDSVAAGLAALEELLPSFLGFALSFLVIGRFWLGHSAALASMKSYDPRLFRPNLYFLMMIALMPFATGFWAANVGKVVPTIFYNSILTLTAIANFFVMRIATDVNSGYSQIDAVNAHAFRIRSLAVVAAACLCVVIALVIEPAISQLPMVLLLLGDRFLPKKIRILP
jgi:uncharacterized membrane protein